MSENVVELLKKLAYRIKVDHEGPEKENAKRMYSRIKKKYNISDAEVLLDEKQTRIFSIRRDQDIQLLAQIYGKYFDPQGNEDLKMGYVKVSRTEIGIELTEVEHKEIYAKYNYWKEQYKKRLSKFKKEIRAKRKAFDYAFLKSASLLGEGKGNGKEPDFSIFDLMEQLKDYDDDPMHDKFTHLIEGKK